MPIYSYKCSDCEKIFDKFEKPTNSGKVKCPDCGSEALRIFSPVGIVFKGSGFYSTDYNSKSSKPASSVPPEIKKDEKEVDKKTDKASSPAESKTVKEKK
ncbi:MAG TPA: zinc ribbon domain-containing protein [Actinobacteria bacterium]|mgnify:CR=1 FL=1|jgi:putative FmdB family regulatory protein|nr:zinc ribbon domain-containing protein [Actinomycetota bacterium]